MDRLIDSQDDAAAARRRAFKSSTGRAEVTRVVRQLKAAGASSTVTAKTLTLAVGQGNSSGAATGAGQARQAGQGRDKGGRGGREVEVEARGAEGSEVAVARKAGKRGLATRAVQLFGLFDGECT